MNRFPAILLFLLLFSTSGMSQTWSRMQSWGLNFESVYWINSQDGVIAGEKLILYTSDGGTRWNEVLQRFDVRFHDVVFLDEVKGVAVGDKGSIFVSSDKGKSWVKKESGSTQDLFSVAKASSSQLIAVGKNGEILLSFDGGNTWEKEVSGTNLSLNDAIFVNQNTAFIAADEGKVLRSFDRGMTWSTTSLGKTNDLLGIAFSSELNGFVVGENGLIEKTTDGGATWTLLNSNTTNSLKKITISPLDARVAVAVGDLATIVKTTNTGTSFSKINLGTATRNVSNIAFKPNTNEFFATGQDGYLLFSANAGSSWTQRLAGIRNHFTSVDFKSQTTGFIAGESGNLFVTSNSAVTLVNRPLPEPLKIETIDFWNTAFGYTSSSGGKIYRTGNTGSAWTPTFNPSGKTVKGFYLFAPSVLYAAGDQGYISRSFDSGLTWDQSIVSNTTTNLKDVTFFDFVFGFAIGENGQISWSSGGNVWQNISKLTSENLNALAKLDTTRAIVVGNGGVILKTEDKARTWKKIESGTTKKLNSVDFFNENVGFISGDEGLALVSLDGGETWLNSQTGTLRNLTGVSAGTDTKAYFVGEDGTILTYDCIPPTGTLGDILGDAQSCITSAVYSVDQLPLPGSQIIWRVDGGEIISGQGTNTIEVNWTTPGRNAVLVSRSNFCGSGQTSALEVSVVASPSTNQTIEGQGADCVGNSTFYSLPNFQGTTYTWTVSGGEVIEGQGTHQIQVKWTQAGTQIIGVTQENRCAKATPIQKSVIVNSAPGQPSPILGETLTGLGTQIYEVEIQPGLDYRWSISGTGGKIISGQGTGEIQVSWEEEGEFEISVEAQNECNFGPKRVLPVTVNIITAVEPQEDFSLKIYPNPSQGNLTISSSNLDHWSNVLVFNPVGQLIQSWEISPEQNQLNLTSLPRGLVLIQLQGKNGVLTRKVLVK